MVTPRPLAVPLAAAAGCLLTFATFYPGFMSNDSLLQLGQARSGSYTDWYPPLMAFTWRYLDMIAPGPAPMLALQVAAWWAGLALCCRGLGPLGVLAAGFWPPLFGMIGTIWKDSQMLAAYTLACGLLLTARRGHPVALWASLALLVYGTAMRQNALVAAVPLLAWWVWTAWTVLPGARRGALVAVAIGALAVPLWIPSALQATRAYHEQEIMTYDLLGMSVRTGENLLPASVQKPPLSLQELRDIYHPESIDPVYYSRDRRTLSFLEDADSVAALRTRWWESLTRAPAAYASHRWAVLRVQLGLADSVYYPFHPGIDANTLGIPTQTTPLAKWVLKGLEALTHTPLYRTWLYIAALLLCLGAACRRGASTAHRVAVAALASSGLLYMAAYAVVSLAADLRFNAWPMEAAILCGVLIAGRCAGLPALCRLARAVQACPRCAGLPPAE